jgi:ATP-dependent DNA ligase
MREFRKYTGRNVRPQVWFIDVEKNVVISKWGLLYGILQKTQDIIESCGIFGHANFRTAEQQAMLCLEREIKNKIDSGYVEYIDGNPTSEVSSEIDFSKPLPKNLCLYKPKKEISDKAIRQLEKDNRAIWTLKRDGMMHLLVKRLNNWEIYSRRMDLVTEKFPHIVEIFSKLTIPNNTIILGEMCLLKPDGSDDFKGVSKICRSDPDLSLAYQGFKDFPKRRKDESVIGKISYYVFDIAFLDGNDLISSMPVKERLGIIRQIFRQLDNRLKISTGRNASLEDLLQENKLREGLIRKYNIGPIKIYKTDSVSDLELTKKLKAEGFVLLDSDACYGDKSYSFDGKAQRPDGIWKRKPKYEDEFVITSIYGGTGRNRDVLGGFTLKQIHPDTGEWIDCGKCGGGFTDDQRREFTDEELIGKTIKIEFDSRQPPRDGVYALRFPEFKGFADKTPEECIAQYLDVVADE